MGTGEEFIQSALRKILPVSIQLQEETHRPMFGKSSPSKPEEEEVADVESQKSKEEVKTPTKKKNFLEIPDTQSERSVTSSCRGGRSAKKQKLLSFQTTPSKPQPTNEEIMTCEKECKPMTISEGDDERDQHPSNSLFMPHMDETTRKNGMNLMYGPLNVLMFMKYFYAVYERIMKAKELIAGKIQTDIE